MTGLDSGISTFSGTSWQGLNLPPMTIKMIGGTSGDKAYSYLIFKRYLNNALVSEGFVTIHMPSVVHISDYTFVEDNTVKWLCRLDLERMSLHLTKTGMADSNVSDWANIEGEIAGMCDKLTLQILYTTGYGHVENVGVTPNWWKL